MRNRLQRGNTMDATNMWLYPGNKGSDGVTRGDPRFRNVNDAFRKSNDVLSLSRSVSSSSVNPSDGGYSSASGWYQKPQIESDEEMMGWSGITFIIFMVIIFIGIIVFIISVIYHFTTGKSMFTGRPTTSSTDDDDDEELGLDKNKLE
jgi:hypothetical protein